MRIIISSLGAVALCSLLAIAPQSSAAEHPATATASLEMSRTLTLRPDGNPPAPRPVAETTGTQPAPQTGLVTLAPWLLLLALVPAAFWWRRRQPASDGTRERARLQARLQNLAGELESSEAASAQHKAHADRSLTEARQLLADKQHLATQLQASQLACERIARETEEARQHASSREAALMERDEQLASLRAEAEVTAEALRARGEKLASQLAEAAAGRNRLEAALQSAAAQQEAQCATAADTLRQAEDRAALAEAAAHEARVNGERLASQLAEATAGRNRLEAALQDARAERETLRVQADETARDLTLELDAAGQRVQAIEAKKARLEQSTSELESRCADATAGAKISEAHLAAVTHSVQQYKREARAKVARIKRKLQAMLDERNALVVQVEAEKQAREGLQAVASEIPQKDALIERLRKELTKNHSVIAALNDLQESADDDDGTDIAGMGPEAMRRQLAQAKLQIKTLKADVRVREDVIGVFEEDTRELPQLEESLGAKDAHIAVLQTELNLAVTELARLRGGAPDAGGTTDAATLRCMLDDAENMLARQAEIIAHFERESGDASTAGNAAGHLARIDALEEDLRASGSLIRHLESELIVARQDDSQAPPRPVPIRR